MTSFAVLMQLTDEFEIPTAHQKALSYITYISVSLSVLCLAATIALFIVCKLYKKTRIVMHINLAASLLLAQLMFVTGVNAKAKVACIAVTVMLHYLWLVVFMWMLMEGVHLFLKVNPNISWGMKLPICIPIAWGIPAFIAITTLGVGISKYRKNEICWLPMTDGLIYAFAGPVIFITMVNMVLLAIILQKFLGLKTNQDKTAMERVSNVQASKAAEFGRQTHNG
ncbi:adhesion G protein-coupled receptor E4-like [Amphiura filiformis]|uniref:adhesion G protein-coupled receptor E4-like n=1 Tax=Amphiura filiformis TaxID=82378 RepID=UPI003B22590C